MLTTTLHTQPVLTPRASLQVAPPARRDYGVGPTSHAFATPVVREVPRPTAEPPWFEATW